MENVAALQLFGLLDLLQADDARVVDPLELVFLGVHVREALKLVDELTRLDKELDGLTQAHKGVNNLTEEVDRELLPREYVGEEFDVEEQGNGIKDERDDVEHKALLRPLLPVV